MHKWDDSTNMVLREVGFEDVEWIELAEKMLHLLAFVT